MNRSYRITPVYTGDVSGVCSALYELDGMTVIHDPSGCNSTYNTHDETRWYNHDSLIFLSGLKHRDAIMGNDNRLIDAVLQAAGQLKPKFITLCGSPIPYINGTDYSAIGRIIENKAKIPVLVVQTNGMHDYTLGAGAAFREFARHFVTERKQVIANSLNILGMTPLDFSTKGDNEALRTIIENQGWQVISNWAMGSSIQQCQQAGSAQMNLVVSSTGIETAKYLEQKFGTPYVVGCPVGEFAQEVFSCLEAGKTAVAYSLAKRSTNSIPLAGLGSKLLSNNVIKEVGNKLSFNHINTDIASEQLDEIFDGQIPKIFISSHKNAKVNMYRSSVLAAQGITLVGEAVTMESIGTAIEKRYHVPVQVICPLETYNGLLREQDLSVHGEEAVEKLLQNARRVLADPLYHPLCRPETVFYSLPHQAFSGRCFRKEERNIFQWLKQDNDMFASL